MTTTTLTVSSPMILESSAGYYIGTTIFDSVTDTWTPHTRDSEYHSSYSSAATELIMNNFMSCLNPEYAKGFAPEPDLPY